MGCSGPSEPFPPVESPESLEATDAPQSTQEPQASLPSVSIVEVFGSGVVHLLNAVDLGDRSTKVAVCQGVSDAVAGLTQTQIDDAKSSMTAYDRSVLQDLVTECEAL